jgi:hypothetical protein
VAFEKIRAKQRATMSNIKHGDANTKLFYLGVNGRKRKNIFKLSKLQRALR